MNSSPGALHTLRNLRPVAARPMRRRRPWIAALLAYALVPGAGCGPARAGEPAAEVSPAEERARALVEEVRERAGADGPDGLGAWTRSVMERALMRAGRAATGTAQRDGPGPDASPAPLPAERHAAALAGERPDTADVIVFMSLAVPAPSWRQWAREAARIGAPLVLRGVGEAGLRGTVQAVGERLGGAQAGVAVDPRLFRLFGVERVPAVAVVPGGVPACASRGCADDAPPPFDRVTGNIGLAAALEAVGAEGSAGRAVARRALERLRGEGER